MSTTTRTCTHGISPRAARTKGTVAFLKSLHDIWRERQSLKRLDDHLLRDIGHTRSEADAEARRAFWDAPDRWLR